MINVAFCCDNNVIDYLKVAIISLLRNRNDDTHFNIIGLCSEKAWSQVYELSRIVEEEDPKSSITIKKVCCNLSSGFVIRDISTATYYRFDLAASFPECEKVIYLDVDVLVRGDLSELWNTELGDNYLSGVKADVNINHSWNNKMQKLDYWKEMEECRGKYINAGVLLMNFKKIRETQIDLVWKSNIEIQFFYQDQDIINMTCKPDIGILPMRYNAMTFYTDKDYAELASQGIYDEYEVELAKNNPVIFHYAGKKPWNDLCTKRGEIWWNFVLNDKYLRDVFFERYNQLKSVELSIIIPVYNSAAYLRQCLDSIKQQYEDSYELICIDDGSVDDSLNILKEYERSFSNIKILSLPHQGLSAARNHGLKIARGSYVFFVDSDDIVASSFIREKLDIALHHKLDVLLFSFENICFLPFF